MSRDVFGKPYLPGYVGCVDLGKTDYMGATIVAVGMVEEVRDWFLGEGEKKLEGYIGGGYQGTPEKVLLFEFGKFIRRIWSPDRLRAAIDPQGFVKIVERASNGKFKVGQGGEGSGKKGRKHLASIAIQHDNSNTYAILRSLVCLPLAPSPRQSSGAG